ncbi:hypothetical protein [Hymenobacter actinosclerus]|uniref:Uncharacterized protein n=1 Tax=Hymenobacter actinosclerus TaxID=82805 RepID=A0A1H9YPU6_9BACT|nr:hypothetical protein [Hymenobacter actinosclerus]SES71092.1 hypothetical protein SAMN04487998_0042 [Hymenobacter actinosclerus]
MRYTYWLIVLLLCNGCRPRVPETPWTTLKVDDQLLVQLPAQPQEISAPDIMATLHPQRKQDDLVEDTQVYRLEDTSAVYVVIRIPMLREPPFSPDPEVRKSYYLSRAIPLMMNQASSILLEQSVVQQNGFDRITVKYREENPEGIPIIKYTHMLTVGKAVYQLHFLPLRQSGDFKEAERLRFFNSVEIQQPAED